MILLIMGPQGSGKGTQAKRLAGSLGLFYFDAGAALRKIAKTNPRINEIVNERGALLPDNEIFEIVTKSLTGGNNYDNLILDGYPRSITQYRLIADWFAGHGSEITKAIYLKLSEPESIRRLSARRADPKTGKVYNLLTRLPGPEVDVKKLTQREDDTPEAIRERLKLYHETTEPLVKMLKAEGKLIEVDGEREVEEIYSELEGLVKGL